MDKKLQVFISSTYFDLRDDRQAAVEAVLEAGHIPAGMELFAAGNESQWEIIKDWIDESDVFLLILGGRYGSLEPNSGLSYIEQEYRYAVNTDTPVVTIMLSKKAVGKKFATDESFVESENIEKLGEFRDLVSERMVEFAEDAKDVKLAIHKALPAVCDRFRWSSSRQD